jgi:hypothetical protein
VRKGRKKPGERQIETLYYCCGGYIAKGNAICERSLVSKEAFERLVVNAARKQLENLAGARGAPADLNAGPTGREPCRTEEITAQLSDRKRRLGELVDMLTPDLKDVLRPKILDLRAEIAGLEHDLDRRPAIGTGRHDGARATAASIAAWADRANAMLGVTTSAAMIRAVLRAIVKQIVIDPETRRSRIEFRAIPDLENDPTIAA